jgi:hypothetical protein
VSRRAAAGLGLAGSALGVVAGLVQAVAGSDIPQWTGNKNAPVALGLLTIGLSVLAGIAALAQRRDLSVPGRAACALGLVVPALLCLTTVGRLWYLPAVLLLAAALSTVDSWRETAAVVGRNWSRVLLGALGACELLMAARATPAAMTAGFVGGLALLAAAWLRTVSRGILLGLAVLGTVPFAALAWTALVPLLLALVAVVLLVPILRAPPRTRDDPVRGRQGPAAADPRLGSVDRGRAPFTAMSLGKRRATAVRASRSVG